MLPRLDKLAENCAEYLKSHKRWLNYFTFWKQGGKDHTAEQLATEMEGIIEELGNSDQNLVLNKLMDYPVIGGYNQLNANLNGKIGLAFGIFFPIGLPVYLLATYQRKLLRHDIQVVQKTSRELEDMIRNLEIKIKTDMTEIKLNTIEEAIEDFREGKFLIVVDDEDRENEGDFIVAAEKITPEK